MDNAIHMSQLKIEYLSGTTIVKEEIDKITGKVFVIE